MKYLYSILILSIFAVSFSCTSDSTTEKPIESIEQPVDETKGVTEIIEPPKTEEHLKVEKEFTELSPFLEEGCCREEKSRTETCCCEKVLEKYKEMIDRKDPKLADYSMTDPILGACRKKMVTEFDRAENPVEEKETVEEETTENSDWNF